MVLKRYETILRHCDFSQLTLFQIEVVSWMTRTALELICQSGLGTSFDTLVDDTAPHPYATSAKALM